MAIPTTGHLDSTLAFVREGYRFASNRCDELGTDIFETRLLLEPTILMRGPKLTELFYDTDKFTRVNAAPERVLDTLFGKGGVQGLDGNAHEHRKAMFMSILGRESLPRLVTTVERHWYQHVERWEKQDQIVLHRALQELLVTAACEWLGIPLADDELAQRTDDVTAMIDGAGGVAARYLRARLGRRRSERWIGDVIRMARAGAHDIDEGSGVHVVAEHRDPNGELLSEHVASVEILNLLRPMVAIARFGSFTAHALHQHPGCATRLDDAAYRKCFVEEVRRFYPFFPMVAARVRRSFVHHGRQFDAGQRVLLDLYGSNHHRATWDDPDRFRPERFESRPEDPFVPIPQGGGSFLHHHRCAGEHVTRAILSELLQLLTDTIDYDVPNQDWSIDLSRIPAEVASGVVLSRVRAKRGHSGSMSGTARAAE